jgi:group I intron endonuclease
MISGIYKIRNIVNGKCYIGSSKNIHKRLLTHRNNLCKGTHKNKHLQNAWNLYGDTSFVFEIVELTNKLFEVEQHYLNTESNLYNIAVCADNPTRNRKLTEEHKSKLRKPKTSSVNMGRKPGYIHTDEFKRKISSKLKGKKYNVDRRGSLSSTKKLTEFDITSIRMMYSTGLYTHKQLANMFGLNSATTIGNIINLKSWSNV